MRVFGRCTVVFGKPIPAEKLKLGEPRSAARLRECKALLAEELEKLLEENRQYLYMCKRESALPAAPFSQGAVI